MSNVINVSNFDKYANKGLSGMANIGNTCYLNSCMQILSHCYELNDFLNKGEYKQKLNRVADSIIMLEWDKLRELLWNVNCTVAPHGFVKSVQKIAQIKNRDIFTGHAQNDVQEFLLFIIDCFHNALAREVEMHINGQSQNETDNLATACYNMMKNMYKKEYSEMLNIFYGIHVSEIVSNITNETLSVSPEPFSVISLSIPSTPAPSLFDCFDLYCEPEHLNNKNGNAWYNDNTKQKEDVQRKICFWSLPTVLIIDLKRWHGHGTNNLRKSQQMVSAPLTDVDFSKYVKGYNPNSYVYDLFGVGNHGGGVMGGHYTAYVKNANGKWYIFNDTQVGEIKEENIISPQSYCLFYRKKK
jgi:ubiquitin carboxyl-terminal hydrolase 8